MDDSGFQVVYDVTRDGWRCFSFPLFGVGFLILLLVFPLLVRSGIIRTSKMASGSMRMFGVFFISVWTVIAALFIGRNYLADVNALRSGSAYYVEGPVENFKPMAYTGHGKESFTVGGASFSYSDYVVTPGFNNTSSHGGPIREGLYVRIWYVGDDIVKLEIPKQPAADAH